MSLTLASRVSSNVRNSHGQAGSEFQGRKRTLLLYFPPRGARASIQRAQAAAQALQLRRKHRRCAARPAAAGFVQAWAGPVHARAR